MFPATTTALVSPTNLSWSLAPTVKILGMFCGFASDKLFPSPVLQPSTTLGLARVFHLLHLPGETLTFTIQVFTLVVKTKHCEGKPQYPTAQLMHGTLLYLPVSNGHESVFSHQEL